MSRYDEVLLYSKAAVAGAAAVLVSWLDDEVREACLRGPDAAKVWPYRAMRVLALVGVVLIGTASWQRFADKFLRNRLEHKR